MIEKLLHDAVAVGGGSGQMLGDAIAIVFAHAQDGRRRRARPAPLPARMPYKSKFRMP